MLYDDFLDEPHFPYEHYATDLDHFIAAGRYWLMLLRSAKGFEEGQWQPVLRPVDVIADQLSGMMFWLRNISDTKEISLHTNSLEGCAAQLHADNPPMCPDAIKKAETSFDWTPTPDEIKGQSLEQAFVEAREIYEPFSAWVEPVQFFKPDVNNPAGGATYDAERLILTSEVSRDCEPLALNALDLFLKPGPAAARLNSS